MRHAFRLVFIFLFLAQSAAAMFCPTNFNQITIGDTMDAVLKACGKPDAQKKLPPEDNGPQNWTYYVTTGSNNTLGSPQASLKVEVAFNHGKVINITANAMSLAATTLCNNITSAVGDTAKAVTAACGKPVFIDKSQQNPANAQPPLLEYQYNTSPVVLLIFENGKLKERK